MIELHSNELRVSFPELHPDASCSVSFQRTLRVPDDNQDYPLPAGLGRFPMFPVDDFDTPADWKQHGGVFFPMYQAEAMWIRFGGYSDYPFAVKVAAGKINAVTGTPWSNTLSGSPQDYVVLPKQPWLDGFSAGRDVVRQFVAMPLGAGFTAEEQISGEAEWGGVQLIFYPMKLEEYRRRQEEQRARSVLEKPMFMRAAPAAAAPMGLAPGGRIRQEIAKDPYGLEVWDTSISSRCYVHLLNSASYRQLTGQAPPTQPVTSKDYAKAGLPWFDYYLDGPALPGSSLLAGLDSVASKLLKQGQGLADNKPVNIARTIQLGHPASPVVRDGSF